MTSCLGNRLYSSDVKMEKIHEGWLSKSPPERKLNIPFTLFRPKWRRRYFVLHEPPAAESLPGTRAALDYYADPTLKKKIGSINLVHCEEVLCQLACSTKKHLFALRTKHKAHDRTYLLAATSDEDMNRWVDCLCWVLGLKESNDDQRTPPSQAEVSGMPPEPNRRGSDLTSPSQSVPPSSPPHQSSSGSLNSSTSSNLRHALPPTPIQHRQIPPVPSQSHSPPGYTPVTSQDAYIPLEECTSGPTRNSNGTPRSPLDQVPPAPAALDRFDRLQRANSIPDTPPPPPPNKTGQSHLDVYPPAPRDVGGHETYDHPKMSYLNLDALEDTGGKQVYDYPKRSYLNLEAIDDNDNLYKMPPPPAPAETPDDSLYTAPNNNQPVHLIQTAGSKTSPSLDTVPARNYHGVPQSSSTTGEDLYKVPPPHKPTLITRENQGGTSRDSNSSTGSRSSQNHIADSGFESSDMYDYPRSKTHTSHHLVSTVDSVFEAPSENDVYDHPRPRPSEHHSMEHLSRKGPNLSPKSEIVSVGRKAVSQDTLLDSVPPPPRPPKQDNQRLTRESRYMNLPPDASSHTYNSPGQRSQLVESTTDDWYDFPRQQTEHELLERMPPPPPHGRVNKHRYINAPPGYTQETLPDDDMYLPMDASSEATYLPMQGDTGCEYVNNTAGSNTENLYNSPSSNRPIPQLSRNCSDFVPAPVLRPLKQLQNENVAVFPTHRTRSFKRVDRPSQLEVPLPTRRGGASDDTSSSEDETDDSFNDQHSVDSLPVSDLAQSRGPAMKSLDSKPPAPSAANSSRASGDHRLQYLSLDLVGHSAPDPKPPREPPARSSSPTEYKEIDFVKTQALKETKKELENKRKSSERSMDE